MHINIRWKILYHKHGEGDTKKCSSEEEVGGRGAIKKDFEKSPYCDQGGYHHYLHVGSTPSVGVQGLLSIQLGRLLGGTNKYTTEIHNHRNTWYNSTFKC